MDFAIKQKLTLQNPIPSTNYNEYEKIVREKGWEKGGDFLLQNIAKDQIKLAMNSKRITELKRTRMLTYWNNFVNIF